MKATEPQNQQQAKNCTSNYYYPQYSIVTSKHELKMQQMYYTLRNKLNTADSDQTKKCFKSCANILSSYILHFATLTLTLMLTFNLF